MTTSNDRPTPVGYRHGGNAAYAQLLERRALYEEPGYEGYRERRDAVVAGIPRDTPEYEELDELVLRAHFYLGSWDWYVVSYDPDYDEAWGLVRGLEQEWGSFWLREVETTMAPLGPTSPDGPLVECDLHWQPVTYGEWRTR